MLGIFALASLEVGAYLYQGQNHGFNQEVRINGAGYNAVSDKSRGDYVKPESSIEAVFPVYVHPEENYDDKLLIA